MNEIPSMANYLQIPDKLLHTDIFRALRFFQRGVVGSKEDGYHGDMRQVLLWEASWEDDAAPGGVIP